MLGLKRGIVLLSDHDQNWSEEYETEKRLILSVLNSLALRIAHIGSTAIPGIKAKPIIDIALEVKNGSAVQTIAKILQSYDYTFFGDREAIGDFFLAKGPERKRTHYLHVSIKSSTRFDQLVYFRDQLRTDSMLAKKYEKLKETLAVRYQNDRSNYTRKKNAFINSIMRDFSFKKR